MKCSCIKPAPRGRDAGHFSDPCLTAYNVTLLNYVLGLVEPELHVWNTLAEPGSLAGFLLMAGHDIQIGAGVASIMDESVWIGD